jgi:antitoxin VapB
MTQTSREIVPGHQPRKVEHYRAKVFKSGNSLAVRIPAGTKLAAGMELELKVEDGEYLSLQPINPPKRKFNIDKVWGSAIGSGLQPIDHDNRFFEERPLLWGEADTHATATPDE